MTARIIHSAVFGSHLFSLKLASDQSLFYIVSTMQLITLLAVVTSLNFSQALCELQAFLHLLSANIKWL